jgi:hypothetical protein
MSQPGVHVHGVGILAAVHALTEAKTPMDKARNLYRSENKAKIIMETG